MPLEQGSCYGAGWVPLATLLVKAHLGSILSTALPVSLCPQRAGAGPRKLILTKALGTLCRLPKRHTKGATSPSVYYCRLRFLFLVYRHIYPVFEHSYVFLIKNKVFASVKKRKNRGCQPNSHVVRGGRMPRFIPSFLICDIHTSCDTGIGKGIFLSHTQSDNLSHSSSQPAWVHTHSSVPLSVLPAPISTLWGMSRNPEHPAKVSFRRPSCVAKKQCPERVSHPLSGIVVSHLGGRTWGRWQETPGGEISSGRCCVNLFGS